MILSTVLAARTDRRRESRRRLLLRRNPHISTVRQEKLESPPSGYSSHRGNGISGAETNEALTSR